MKKIITMMLCATISLLTLVGCGEERKENISSPVEDTNQSTELKNAKNGHIIDYVYEFSDGYSWIKVVDTETGDNNNYRYAFINSFGEIQFFLDEKIEGTALYAGGYKDGFSLVNNGKELLVMNTQGEILLSATEVGFDDVLAFGDGYFAVQKYVNDFHTAEYKVFVIDQQGNMIGDYLASQQEAFDSYDIDYLQEGIFTYPNNDSKLFNAKTGKSIEINPDYEINEIYDCFVNGNCLVSVKDINTKDYQLALLHKDGSLETCKTNTPSYLLSDGISDDGFIYSTNTDNSVEDLYFYDLLSKKSNLIYSCGTGIELPIQTGWGPVRKNFGSNIFSFNNGYSTILIRGNKSSYFTVVDKLGNIQFEPKECYKAEGISCNRIVSEQHGDYKIFTEKGEEIPIPDDYIIHQDSYSDNLIAVHKEIDEEWSSCNYIDIDGNLLFENDMIYY